MTNESKSNHKETKSVHKYQYSNKKLQGEGMSIAVDL